MSLGLISLRNSGGTIAEFLPGHEIGIVVRIDANNFIKCRQIISDLVEQGDKIGCIFGLRGRRKDYAEPALRQDLSQFIAFKSVIDRNGNGSGFQDAIKDWQRVWAVEEKVTASITGLDPER